MAIYSREDRFALHRFKADEAYLVARGKDPVQAYLRFSDTGVLRNILAWRGTTRHEKRGERSMRQQPFL